MLILWILVFLVSLFVLIKAADYFTEGAEKIGLALKISPFIVGVTIVSIGTSLPELATSIVALLRDQTEIVVANALGSNIANILLVVGICAIIAGVLSVRRSLIDIDLPLLLSATALIVVIMWDKQVTLGEGLIAIIGYLVYAGYTIRSEKEEKPQPGGILPGEDIPATREKRHKHRHKRNLNFSLIGVLAISTAAIYFSADWTVKSMLQIAGIVNINASVVSMVALAIGTSLPELVVSLGAVRKKKYEIALGNVFGSNIFNALMLIGIPALFKPLKIDDVTFSIGVPFLIGATLIYTFSGISKKIHKWEGMMYILIYILFVAKLLGAF
ncbi:MAG: conjugal transfer protein TraR [Candidatus Komeilibacteria bacterium CG10_big_fil_rev_8_21_14_0_10_41_13]|uniref:Conjugal transfer protein TraR n=1 Tax=Candidatus Komeilibacteria bacterium CG10_big_fil_rev_8_21_14_0_10_41_13 TaxID=1974476 RepID=A0A2M6WCI4_9BACT|nr:MAG: conjugal transfer protein TraR [Candidatus Komeilibacteria bacterium CG10_big_fil_rev_8_21_14_0_10_41_13]